MRGKNRLILSEEALSDALTAYFNEMDALPAGTEISTMVLIVGTKRFHLGDGDQEQIGLELELKKVEG